MASLDNYLAALKQIESSGNYGSVGPPTRNGDRAYGAYQVMGKNVPEWTRIALGQSMAPDAFLKDNTAQDAVAKHFFGKSLDQYGNPQDAASVWFSGRPMAAAGNASDGYNTVPQYVQKFNKALGAGGGGGNPALLSHMDGNEPPGGPMQSAFMPNLPSIPEKADDMLPPNAQPTEMDASKTGGLFGFQQGTRDKINNFGDALSGIGAGLISVNNPAAAASLMNAQTARKQHTLPTWGVIGQDMFGQPKYGWINRNTQTTTPANGSGSGGSGSGDDDGLESSLTKMQSAQQAGAAPEDLLKMAPPAIRSDLKALINNEAIPTNMGRGGKMKAALLMMAHTIDPNFDETKLPGRVQFQKNLANGSLTTMGGQKQSVGTALEHLGEVGEASIGLHNLNGPDLPGGALLGKLGNMIGNSSNDAQAKTNAYRGGVDKYVGEVGKIYSGNQGGGVKEREESRGHFGENNSPEAQARALEMEMGLLKGKYNQMQAQADEVMGPGKVKIIGPDQEKAIARIEKQIETLRARKGAHESTTTPTNRPPLGDIFK